MPYGILFLYLFLLPHTYCSSEASFEPPSATPKLGDDLYLVCKLKAPKGDKFHGTTPDLITDGVDSHFRFTDIRNYIFDSRYNGFESVDPASLELEGILSIKAINASDLSRHFTCFQTLVMSGENVSCTITLGTFVHTTTSSHTPELTSTKPDTTDSSPSTTDTGDVTIHSTHTTSPPVESTNSLHHCRVEISVTAVVMLIIFVIFVLIFCFCLLIYKKVWPKWRKFQSDRRRSVCLIRFTANTSPSPKLTSEPKDSQQQVAESGVINLKEEN